MIDRCRSLLVAALGFALLELQDSLPPLTVLKTWPGSWVGIGAIAAGMARQGFDISLTRYDERGWRATFYGSGMEHSPVGAIGTPGSRRPPERSSAQPGPR